MQIQFLVFPPIEGRNNEWLTIYLKTYVGQKASIQDGVNRFKIV